jgi:hypothetical protein
VSDPVATAGRAGDAPESWPLSPRAARVFYNVADAWLAPDRAPTSVDWVAALGPLAPPERARLERALAWLERSPWLALHARCGLSWLPRDARRAWLDRLERHGPLRSSARLVRATLARAAEHVLEQSLHKNPDSARSGPQSLLGP